MIFLQNHNSWVKKTIFQAMQSTFIIELASKKEDIESIYTKIDTDHSQHNLNIWSY